MKGICRDTGCGNSLLEAGEVCDDGNTRAGDGCSRDCRSDETCGNGIVDPLLGEQCDDANNNDEDGCLGVCAAKPCGNGELDGGEVCDDGNNSSGDGCNAQCTGDESCGNGVIDVVAGEECDDGGRVPGDGCGSGCHIEVCGNGLVDVGEECDDGGNLAGDDCGPTCHWEECGNEFVDPGEGCDDGNFENHDGCSSECRAEAPTWRVAPNQQPALQLVVYAPGLGGTFGLSADVKQSSFVMHRHELSGWSDAHPIHVPPFRNGASIGYDPMSGAIVLFGGRTSKGVETTETWRYDGLDWELVTTAAHPVAPCDGAFAFVRELGGLVYFGGSTNDVESAAAWLFRQNEWSPLDFTGPSARRSFAFASDPSAGTAVLFGGIDAQDGILSDTWLLGKTGFTELVTGSDPSARHSAAMAFFPGKGLVLFGGEGPSFRRTDAWVLQSGAWSQLTSFTPYAPASLARLAYDSGVGTVLLVEVIDKYGKPGRRTWTMSTNAWLLETAASGPEARASAALAYDEKRQAAVLFGGSNGVQQFGDTWVYADERWTQRQALASPSARSDHAMAFDRDHSRVVLFGGAGYDGVVGDLWGLEPSSPSMRWSKLAANTAIGVRSGARLVHDSAKHALVLFGGKSSSNIFEQGGFLLADSIPTPLASATEPSARAAFGFAADPKGGGVLLFGWDGTKTLADVWTYDSAAFAPALVESGPTARSGATFLFHEKLGRYVLYGGMSAPSVATGDTWELDGTKWRVTSPAVHPSSIRDSAAAYHRERKSLLFVSGRNESGESTGETWEYLYTSATSDEQCDSDLDEDGDGLVDCLDPDCDGFVTGAKGCLSGSLECIGTHESECGDGVDEDCDGLTDCRDPDCGGTSLCSSESLCDDLKDNDGDGRTDCADPGCSAKCERAETNCLDGFDNDGSGDLDCADPNCRLLESSCL